MKTLRIISYYLLIISCVAFIIIGKLATEKYSAHQKAEAFKVRVMGNIHKLQSGQDLSRLKDGEMVWISGRLSSEDSITIPIRDQRGYLTEMKNFGAIYVYYYEEKYRSGRRRHWVTEFTLEKQVSSANIDGIPVDIDMLIDEVEPQHLTIYNDDNYYRANILEIPYTSFSCIATYKDGKLTKADDDFFLYSGCEDIDPKELTNNFVKSAKESMEQKFNLLYTIAAVLLISLLLILLTRNKTNYKELQVSSYISNEIKKLNMLRYAATLAIVVVCVLVYYVLSAWITWAIVLSGLSIFISTAVGNDILKRIYKKNILKYTLNNHKNIEEIGEISLGNGDLGHMGIINNSDERKGVFFKSSIRYEFATEDMYRLNSYDNNVAFDFFELRVKRIKGNGKNKSEEIVLNSFCIMMPLNIDKEVRFNIEPLDYDSNTGMDYVDENKIDNTSFLDEMKLSMSHEEKSQKFLDNTPFLDNVGMIRNVLKEKMQDENIVFAVYNSCLYVFDITHKDRFEATFYSRINAHTVMGDIIVYDAMEEISRKWKAQLYY